jgi:hypothetical protein
VANPLGWRIGGKSVWFFPLVKALAAHTIGTPLTYEQAIGDVGLQQGKNVLIKLRKIEFCVPLVRPENLLRVQNGFLFNCRVRRMLSSLHIRPPKQTIQRWRPNHHRSIWLW